jgi:hypothetical protein
MFGHAHLPALLALALATPLSAQSAQQLPLIPEAREIALALSAGPEHIAAGATVYVLRRGGYVKAREGTNGFSCLVERDHPESLAPICYDAEASRTILPGWFALTEMREKGQTHADAKDRIMAMYRDGRLTPPSRPAMSYMLSADQVLYSGPEGRRVGAWKPHIMLFTPGITNADLGTTSGDSTQPFVMEEGTPFAHIVVAVTGPGRVAAAEEKP